jgi:hypothetical protein
MQHADAIAKREKRFFFLFFSRANTVPPTSCKIFGEKSMGQRLEWWSHSIWLTTFNRPNQKKGLITFASELCMRHSAWKARLNGHPASR